MPPKRKSERAVSANESVEMPSKRLRNTVDAPPASAESASVVEATPQTIEKRGRGRPRKYPESSTPKPDPDAPKRGRGRPRKIVSEQESEAVVPAGPKRGRGRPRKDSGDATPVTPKIKKKDGRGRPRKDSGDATSATPTIKKKDGRGRPRKNPLPNGEAETESKVKPVVDVIPETGRSFWLMKAEPESRLEKGKDVKFSIDDLATADTPEPWDGVRNHVAKNLMRNMKKGDYAFFYHSNCKVPGIVGVMEIVKEHSTDGLSLETTLLDQFAYLRRLTESAFDSNHPYYDPKSKRDDPKWVVVHVEYRRKLEKQVTLQDLKSHGQTGKPLENLQMIKQSRLSVSSVTPAQWKYILELAGEEPQEEFTKKESSAEEEQA
ncbi:High mobility group HMG-I/HMG-Y [Penicillium coprophilum]|uniref:High mobility group HMG-I/HMG-Y n=1 Tax=Penicillium coprophilum TaxID=36646 RepID=UPI0023A4CCAC|nr:High mobility group HMG-I/HMG-Y [Penicillium coprophilum]KAJ5163404.1 High mobility group HMG-I/HMG-Y [Penicillium coprophilum]